MKLMDLLHYIAHDVYLTISQVDFQNDDRIVYEGKKEDLSDYLIDRESEVGGNYIFGIEVVSIDTSMFYFDPYDRYDDGEPIITITVTGWKEGF